MTSPISYRLHYLFAFEGPLSFQEAFGKLSTESREEYRGSEETFVIPSIG